MNRFFFKENFNSQLRQILLNISAKTLKIPDISRYIDILVKLKLTKYLLKIKISWGQSVQKRP